MTVRDVACHVVTECTVISPYLIENMCNFLEKGQKKSVFWLFSPFPGFPIRDVTDQKIFSRFLFSWTPKTLTIQKIYSFMGIRQISEELLTCKVTATLREMKLEKNDRRWKERENTWRYLSTRNSSEFRRDTFLQKKNILLKKVK